ncbi:MAG: MBL fold metallo-hydrolase [Acidimicrobiales bacterium]
MFFRQYQLPCLSLYSYLIGDETTGRAVVVDPQRDISPYLDDARANALHIERVIETHFHADFLSGHLELAAATNAVISYGEAAVADFAIDRLSDGQRISLGNVLLEIRHTPGHTPESISIVVWQHADDETPWAVLTGDTLFIGDVGRPDLFAASGLTADAMARTLYRSLHESILVLPDPTRVFPAHGAGSSCGKQLSTAASSTIGEQRATNYALAPMSIDRFVDVVAEGQSVAPRYFPFAATANRRRHELLDDHVPPDALDVDAALAAMRRGAIAIDTRAPEMFASGHLRDAVNVGLDGRFAEYAGDVIRFGQPIVLIADLEHDTEAKVRLARIGFDNIVGNLATIADVLVDRPDLAVTSRRLTAREYATLAIATPHLQVIDVRNPSEQRDGTLPNARTIPLAQLLDRIDELDPRAPTVVYCAGGYRSSIATSLLRSKRFVDVADILGGFSAALAHV